MCQTCGCLPCETCGDKIEEGVCVGCGFAAEECICESVEQEEELGEEDTE